MTSDRQGRPLLAWAVAVGLVLPIAAPLLAPSMASWPTGTEALRRARHRNELIDYLQAPLEERANPKGVMLTMSAGSCATIGPLQLAAGGVDLYVITYPASILEDFDDVVEFMLETAGYPDFVVIQDTLMLHRSRASAYDAYLRARRYWRDFVLQLVQWTRDDARENILEARLERRCPQRSFPMALWADRIERNISRIPPYSDSKAQHIESLLDRFYAAGVAVLVVSPPHNEHSAQYRSLVFETARAFALRESDPSGLPGVTWHRQTEPTPVSEFMDPMHAAPAAAGGYRRWLNGEVTRVIGARDD